MCNTTFNLEAPLFDNIVKNNYSQFFKKPKQIRETLPDASSRKEQQMWRFSETFDCYLGK